MSTYPFPHIERSGSYKITFLESVKLHVAYECDKENYANFKKFFEDFTCLSLDEKRYETKKISAMRLTGDNGAFTLKFAKSSIDFSINGQAYVGFESNFEVFLRKFSSFLEAIGSDAKEISIEKINLWPMCLDGIEVNINEFKDLVFSKEIRDIRCDDTGIGIKESKDPENGWALLLKYGVAERSDSVLTLILDTKCIKTVNVLPPYLIEEMSNLNQILYDVYHWSVTQDVINVMKKDA